MSVPSPAKVNPVCLPRGMVGLGPLKELGALELLEATIMVVFPILCSTVGEPKLLHSHRPSKGSRETQTVLLCFSAKNTAM